MTTDRGSERRTDRTVRRLRVYVWTGVAYLCAAAVYLFFAWRRGDLTEPVNLIWLAGAVIYAFGVVHSLRRLPEARAGDLGEPDERAEMAAGKAGVASARYLIIAMAIIVGVQTGVTGSLPVVTSLLLIALIVLFFGHYVYYLRKMG